MIRIQINDQLSIELSSYKLQLIAADLAESVAVDLSDSDVDILINSLRTILITKAIVNDDQPSLMDPRHIVEVMRRLIKGECPPADDIQMGETE